MDPRTELGVELRPGLGISTWLKDGKVKKFKRKQVTKSN